MNMETGITQCDGVYEKASITISKVTNGFVLETRQREEYIAHDIVKAIDIVQRYFGEGGFYERPYCLNKDTSKNEPAMLDEAQG